MSQKIRTREETSYLLYLKQSDIRKLFQCSQQTAKKIYAKADDIDNQLTFRAEDKKVRITSVCEVTCMSLNTIKKQAKEGRA